MFIKQFLLVSIFISVFLLLTAASPSKRSLSKWNRNRDPQANVEKKRTGEEEDTRKTS